MSSEHSVRAANRGTENAILFFERLSRIPDPGGTIRTFIVSLLGAAALTAGILVIRNQREAEDQLRNQIPAGEKTARTVSLEKLRELGL